MNEELKQLHEAGFAHRDIRCSSSEAGEIFDNIFLTKQGIRLIEVGISATRSTGGEKLFSLYVEQKNEESAAFRNYYLLR